MNLAASPKGFEKVCGVPAGTVTLDPASTSTLLSPEAELEPAFGHDEGLVVLAMKVLWRSAGPGGTVASISPSRCAVCEPSSMMRQRIGPPPDCSPSFGPTTIMDMVSPLLRWMFVTSVMRRGLARGRTRRRRGPIGGPRLARLGRGGRRA